MAVELYQRKKGLSALTCFSIQPRARCSDLLIDGFHALLGQRAGVFNGLLAYSAPAGISRRVILVSCEAVQHASGSELLLECRILGIVGQFRLFFGVQVIEIAEEFVESVHGRQDIHSDRRDGFCRTGRWHSRAA